ncbi:MULTISPECIES: triose-phosphate isomerase [unclassified Candidatus Frackibacter]|jgi:triosephosphate isomerase|uniref:triose-phosphate isomerase n=1 Tax=unclassified Candidatus Frackibacter TaxID=2648818 RepID=UPI000798B08C|nr:MULTISPECIES: triose-phosphate isomerase [unclassified Candidatus Frackibacter]KXS43308.1 MAG: triosephosphate isomerase (TIM) [Candidatus Frackibacter sp. T328-2]SDC70283.1 triosephosphate isomerase [Candidatus Frackibacter sp. WG11]SEM85222.1 triosephosphate isomerase [Candidatus Frackibacter sp. WG12]SFL94444.1 triosephosphate isomerase [Candidatus Frackibacter sp. WG13]
MRRPFIAGNWKMHKTNSEAVKMVKELVDLVSGVEDVDIAICAPATALSDINKEVADTNVALGAENMFWEEEGAYTGEISPLMLNDVGCEYVILGHSERRGYFNETDEDVNKKVKTALAHQLKPIICIGEKLEEKEAGETKDIVKRQALAALEEVEESDLETITIAYEPIWAIGTGKSATAEDANEVIKYIREVLREEFGKVADKMRIQYGGSVKPHNIAEFMATSDIDGALVGSASLEAESFADIVKFD